MLRYMSRNRSLVMAWFDEPTSRSRGYRRWLASPNWSTLSQNACRNATPSASSAFHQYGSSSSRFFGISVPSALMRHR